MIVFNEDQKKFMRSIGIEKDFENLSDDDFLEIEDVIAGHLQMNGFDENYNITSDGIMCESILDKLV